MVKKSKSDLMGDYVYNRVINICQHIVLTKCTLRQAAAEFSVSKSTVDKDMIDRLPMINDKMFARVRAVLDNNKAERSKRGGEATKKMYEKLKGSNKQ